MQQAAKTHVWFNIATAYVLSTSTCLCSNTPHARKSLGSIWSITYSMRNTVHPMPVKALPCFVGEWLNRKRYKTLDSKKCGKRKHNFHSGVFWLAKRHTAIPTSEWFNVSPPHDAFKIETCNWDNSNAPFMKKPNETRFIDKVRHAPWTEVWSVEWLTLPRNMEQSLKATLSSFPADSASKSTMKISYWRETRIRTMLFCVSCVSWRWKAWKVNPGKKGCGLQTFVPYTIFF